MKLLVVGAVFLSYCGIVALSMSLDPGWGIFTGLAILIAAEASIMLGR